MGLNGKVIWANSHQTEMQLHNIKVVNTFMENIVPVLLIQTLPPKQVTLTVLFK